MRSTLHEQYPKIVNTLQKEFENANFEEKDVKPLLNRCAVECGVVFGDVVMVARFAVSGFPVGIDISKMICRLGKDKVMERMSRASSI